MSGMDFFARQEKARRRTWLLVLLFGCAVLGIIAALYALAMVAMGAVGDDGYPGRTTRHPWFHGEILAWTVGATLIVVGLATLFRIGQMSKGGSAVAQMLGARKVTADTRDPGERKLCNVVEEVAIASGVPVPAVYIMDDEAGINAFAAGYRINDAVIGVTRGCIEQLDRDELQGVVAHEFSHIMNGDMRLNIRLVGVLFGITCIAIGGRIILQTMRYSRGGGDRRGGAAGILVIGLGMLVIGWLGQLFASMIRAAVSRQREFLADAAAVQFTRNPNGIGSALQKIQGISQHGELAAAQAAECSHMFFADAMTHKITSLWATHPPLKDRIAAIFGSAQAALRVAEEQARRKQAQVARGPEAGEAKEQGGRGAKGSPLPGFPGLPGLPGLPGITAGLAGAGTAAPAGGRPALGSGQVVARVGTLPPESLHYAQTLLRRMPLALSTAVHSPLGAQATTLALLLDRDPPVRRAQLEVVAKAHLALHHELTQLAPLVAELERTDHLPVLDLALPALREMSKEQYLQFDLLVQALIRADNKVSLFEFALHQVLRSALAVRYQQRPAPKTRQRLTQLAEPAAVVLSALAHAGAAEPSAALAAYQAARTELAPVATLPTLKDKDGAGLTGIAAALRELAGLLPLDQQKFLGASALAVAHDGQVEVPEYELLRAIAANFDLPLPPVA